jgi:hypothetical protein
MSRVLEELRPGLRRWTARHPEWVAGAAAESPADWPPDVGCVAFEAPDALVLVDPLVPGGEEAAFWAEMDPLAERRGRVHVLTTLQFHRRSRDAFAERYRASTSRARAALPAGVRTAQIRGAGETMVWLDAPRALVPGDRLIGDGRGGLRLCPESWLGYLKGMDLAGLRKAMAPLLELPAELVLVSHGEPVLRDGAAHVAAAIRGEAA